MLTPALGMRSGDRPQCRIEVNFRPRRREKFTRSREAQRGDLQCRPRDGGRNAVNSGQKPPELRGVFDVPEWLFFCGRYAARNPIQSVILDIAAFERVVHDGGDDLTASPRGLNCAAFREAVKERRAGLPLECSQRHAAHGRENVMFQPVFDVLRIVRRQARLFQLPPFPRDFFKRQLRAFISGAHTRFHSGLDLVALAACILQTDRWIIAEREFLLLAACVIPDKPRFTSRFSDDQIQPVRIRLKPVSV